MNDSPIQLFLFGLVDLILEPFCYGCAVFVVTYHLTRSLTVKLVAMLCGILIFIWMDDIWPNLAFQEARMGIASEHPSVAEIFSENPSLGSVQFHSGQETSLFNIFHLRAADIFSAGVFVPLGFVIGMLMTGRQWHEVPSPTTSATPPPIPSKSSPPALPSSTRSDAYRPKNLSTAECRAKIHLSSSCFKTPEPSDQSIMQETKEEKNKNISPKKLWVVYGACMLLTISIAVLPAEQQAKDGLVAMINLPLIITVFVALLCTPVRLIQAAMKKDKRYLQAGLLCGLLPLTHLLITAVIVAGNY